MKILAVIGIILGLIGAFYSNNIMNAGVCATQNSTHTASDMRGSGIILMIVSLFLVAISISSVLVKTKSIITDTNSKLHP